MKKTSTALAVAFFAIAILFIASQASAYDSEYDWGGYDSGSGYYDGYGDSSNYNDNSFDYYGGGSDYYGSGSDYYGGGSDYYGSGSDYYGGGSDYYGSGSDYCNNCYGGSSGSYYDNYDYDTCYSCYTPPTCSHNCTPAPLPDVCPNIAGRQTSIPSGYTKDASGNCVLPLPDVCPNIAGRQTSIPSGMIKDANGNCVTPAPTLSVVCVASPSQARIGDTVTWSANVSGGNGYGSYSYSWSGTDGLGGSSASTYKSYSNSGTKTGTVIVTSGNQTQSATCSTFIEERQSNNLSGFCEVDRTNVRVGDEVRFRASATGGNGNYTYEWNGSSPLSGRTGSTQYVTYNTTGNKSASVTIRTGNESVTRDCNTVVVEDTNNNLSAFCTAFPTRVNVNQQVTWSADASGGNGNYTYEWSGTDGLYGSNRTIYRTYNTPGFKTATVRVYTNGNNSNSVSRTCSVEVVGSTVAATLYENPPAGNLAALSSVYLSQVPYTGPTDVLKYVGYILSLLVLSALGAFFVLKRKAVNNRKTFIENFKQTNLARKTI